MFEGAVTQIEKLQRYMINTKLHGEVQRKGTTDLRFKIPKLKINKKNLEICDIEVQFENKRVRIKKRMAVYEKEDRSIINVAKKFKVEIFNKIFIFKVFSMSSMTTRFI